ncbi:MAG: hypothetical protein LBC98_01825 [Prevotellaceae bacterium]|jgi:hypothetical protein|nr:hypothetical protein [Prevotellaceae bacterium]
MKHYFKAAIFGALVCTLFAACKKDNAEPSAGDKPLIENLTLTPNSAIAYGDAVTLSGKLSDAAGLQSYTVRITNEGGDIYNETKMLTGTLFNLAESLVIPLPRNAQAGNATLSITVKNSKDMSSTEDLTLSNLTVPSFDQLYLIIGTRSLPMTRNGDLYSVEEIIAAEAVGKIYAKADKTGLFWGQVSSSIEPMKAGDISIGATSESNLKITFNIKTFELTIEAAEQWTPITETYYIYGTISGHWQDGDIVTELPSARMTGYKSGEKKYWTWTPPGLDAEDPNNSVPGYDMWGNINPGLFRFKKAGAEEYVLFDGNIITGSTNDRSFSFITTAGGPITIKLYHDGTKFDKITLEASDKSLEYSHDGSLSINGAPAPEKITFAGADLSLKPGSLYMYEGMATLTADQTITATQADLTKIKPDRDVFTGGGNAQWKMIGSAGDWLIRIDPFGYTIYACKITSYPDVIYMDGWGWAKNSSEPATNWIPDNRLCLQRKSPTSYIYEATFYNFGWTIDVSFWSAYLTTPDYGNRTIASHYFTGVEPQGNGIKLPSTAEYTKITVDLKDGFDYDTNVLEGDASQYYKLIPANGKQFTVTLEHFDE